MKGSYYKGKKLACENRWSIIFSFMRYLWRLGENIIERSGKGFKKDEAIIRGILFVGKISI